MCVKFLGGGGIGFFWVFFLSFCVCVFLGFVCLFFLSALLLMKWKLFLKVTELIFLRATERFRLTSLFSLYAHSHKDWNDSCSCDILKEWKKKKARVPNPTEINANKLFSTSGQWCFILTRLYSLSKREAWKSLEANALVRFSKASVHLTSGCLEGHGKVLLLQPLEF